MDNRESIDIALAKFIGMALKQHRKIHKMTQADLEDDQISQSTISNIERGNPRVKRRNIEHLARKIGFDLSPFLEPAIAEYKNQSDSMSQYYQAIETAIDFGVDDNIISKVSENVPATVDDHSRALAYAEAGLESSVEGQGDEHHKHMLLLHKAMHLRQLGENEEALECVSELWPHLHKISNISLLMGAYALHVDILTYARFYKKAIRLCDEGVKIACQSKSRRAASLFFEKLGDIHSELKHINEARNCYRLASQTLGKMYEDSTLMELLRPMGEGEAKQ